MNNIEQKRSGASLFLIELIIGLLIFAFSAAVCARMFAGAYQMSEDSAALSCAVSIARNAAETVRAGGAVTAEKYDALGAPTTGDAAYRLQVAKTQSADRVTEVRLTVITSDGKVLYSLTAAEGEAGT